MQLWVLFAAALIGMATQSVGQDMDQFHDTHILMSYAQISPMEGDWRSGDLMMSSDMAIFGQGGTIRLHLLEEDHFKGNSYYKIENHELPSGFDRFTCDQSFSHILARDSINFGGGEDLLINIYKSLFFFSIPDGSGDQIDDFSEDHLCGVLSFSRQSVAIPKEIREKLITYNRVSEFYVIDGPKGDWDTVEILDRLTDEKSTTLFLNNSQDGYPALTISCTRGELELSLRLKNPIYRAETILATYRISDHPAEVVDVYFVDEGFRVILPDPHSIIQAMLEEKSFLIQLTLGDSPQALVEFDIEGLRFALEPVAEECSFTY